MSSSAQLLALIFGALLEKPRPSRGTGSVGSVPCASLRLAGQRIAHRAAPVVAAADRIRAAGRSVGEATLRLALLQRGPRPVTRWAVRSACRRASVHSPPAALRARPEPSAASRGRGVVRGGFAYLAHAKRRGGRKRARRCARRRAVAGSKLACGCKRHAARRGGDRPTVCRRGCRDARAATWRSACTVDGRRCRGSLVGSDVSHYNRAAAWPRLRLRCARCAATLPAALASPHAIDHPHSPRLQASSAQRSSRAVLTSLRRSATTARHRC
eukprot:scaffold140837_cov28-Tisochrysis_lutea.AAC.1